MLFDLPSLSVRFETRRRRASIVLLVLAGLCGHACGSSSDGGGSASPPTAPSPPGPQGAAYDTRFSLTENPLSEGGRWLNGQANGVDWKDVRTTPGLAFGSDGSGTPHYDDPTAILSGTWNPNQAVEATVYTVNQKGGNIYEEVEIRLRSAIVSHRITGYEIMFRCNHDGTQYVNLARWNGPFLDFTPLGGVRGPGLFNGDVVKAQISGNLITAYINGNQVAQWSDSTFSSGSPGIGYYLDGSPNVNADYGFTRFTVTDAPASLTGLRMMKGSALPY
jgi:hypothetical protein